MGTRKPAEMPSQVSSEVGYFDRFAGWAARLASRAPFFAFCLLLVVIWLIQGAVTVVATRSFDTFLDATYQLEINTTTTIITFLMVALLQNSQTRDNQAVQHKLNAIADGVADLMEHLSDRHEDDDLMHDVEELRDAVGLESRESTSHNIRPPSPPTVSTPPPTGT
jgi:low affinity Fe/Cu permease